MRSGTKLLVSGLLVALAIVAIWRVIVIGMSDHLASESPEQALDWDPGNPVALLAIAKKQLDEKEPAAAQRDARKLLSREPLSGQGFVVLSEVARLQGDKAQTHELSTIALRHVPRALGPRAWLAGEQLEQRHYAEAMDEIDRILRVSPRQNEQLFPVLIELAENPEFADALAVKLMTKPAWRDGLLTAFLGKASPEALDQTFSALQRHGGMDVPTMGRWIDRLVKEGAWGEAYARWVSPFSRNGLDRLTNVYNGGFETQPSGAGFDWRIGDSAGVIIERAPVTGAGESYALSLMFLGRRVDDIPVHQWLLLAPGSYHLDFRATAQDLRSDRGVEWVVACQENAQELASTARMNESFDWRHQGVDFEVPETGCKAQDLWLRNAGAAGAGKIIRGSISFDDFSIKRRAKEAAKAPPANPAR